MNKNITLCVDEKLIEKARRLAQLENTTLNACFREWLEQYVNSKTGAEDFDSIMQKLNYARADRTFTREEMNER
ncbi:MAG: hypothetical protein R6U55_03165 [Desulfovermiculus sp.]